MGCVTLLYTLHAMETVNNKPKIVHFTVVYLAAKPLNRSNANYPFHSEDLISNSPYCLLYNSTDVILKNLVLDQLIIDTFLCSHHLPA